MRPRRADEEVELLGHVDDSVDSSVASFDEADVAWFHATPARRPVVRSRLGRVVALGRRARRHRAVQYLLLLRFLVYALVVLVMFTYFFNPSYAHPPAHYGALEARVAGSDAPGRGNPHRERVFIAISLYDKGGHLAGGRWGEQLLELVDLLGPANTFVSIYENDSGADGQAALAVLERQLPCAHEVVYEDVDKTTFPHVTLPDGDAQLKRITYMAEIRNRSLRPLYRPGQPAYDRVLFLNDIYFNVVDAVQLLFSTNKGNGRRADYIAACGIDYLFSPWKFYDTFATRDLDGYSMGWEYFPFFSSAGSGASRADMLAERDAVRVKSCWSGIAAFDARYLQPAPENVTATTYEQLPSPIIDPAHPRTVAAPARFRAEPESFYDACECCLLMADALQLAKGTTDMPSDSGIYWNPYVRVTYRQDMLWKLAHTRRVERLLTWLQALVNSMTTTPELNPYRTVLQGQPFQEEIWRPDANVTAGGAWDVVDRTGRNGLYCGIRAMSVIRTHGWTEDNNWKGVDIPAGGTFF